MPSSPIASAAGPDLDSPSQDLAASARELAAQGDGLAALEAYGHALDAQDDLDDDATLRLEIGRFALQLGRPEVAEATLTPLVQSGAAPAEAVADLARAQAAMRAFDLAQATLSAALEADATQPRLWLALGEVLCLRGRHADAVAFFAEALRLDPGSAPALDGVADALLFGAGDIEQALAASAEALAVAEPEEIPRLAEAHGRRLLGAGRLAEGWAALGDARSVEVRLAAPRWTPGSQTDGRLLLLGEDDVVSELLFAHAVPSLIGEGRRLILAVDPHAEALMRRSFPGAMVTHRLDRSDEGKRLRTAALDSPHVHGGELVGAWGTLRAALAPLRATPQDFAGAGPYLKVDEARVGHWRDRLAALGPGPKVGVLWRGPSDRRDRAWEAPSLPLLRTALDVPGLCLIAVQAEDVQGELVWMRESFGLSLHAPPPELRLWDLDDLAAFTYALDVVVGPPGPASVLAAASGARAWFLTLPGYWARLGAEAFPWFPDARVIAAAAPNDWEAAMAELKAALGDLAAPEGGDR